MRDYNYISLKNNLIFFLQFLIIVEDKHKFSFDNYRDKE